MELEIRNLTKIYGTKTAVDHLNVTLTNGVYGLLGANGAGKSTLMRLLCDLQRPTAGSVLLNGKRVAGKGRIASGKGGYQELLGYLPQDFRCYPAFTAEAFLLYMAAVKGLKVEIARARVMELLRLVGLEQEAKQKTRTFSGGMRQRLGIAQAMLNDPRILILDEPTAGLDPRERVRFRNLINSFSRDRIVILSTHIVSDVEYSADEILMMKAGKLLHFGSASEIAAKINGFVWECVVPSFEAERIASRYDVSSLKNVEGDRTVLRFLSRNQPLTGAYRVEPTLEDLYLYYFGREE